MAAENGPSPDGDIPAITIPSERLRFSFEHLKCEHDEFPLADCTVEYWQLFVKELNRYDGWDTEDFLSQNNDDARHIVVVEEERVNGQVLQDLMKKFDYSDTWQFGLGPRKDGRRVLGLLVGSTFYIVLLDPNHNVYTTPPESQRDANSSFR